jgi:acyl carrier protein phosphodiesterase
VNFLAHCALARSHPELMIGGFLGDFVKGPVPDDLPGRIADGIRLHRRLDAYSSSQPQMRRSARRLPRRLRRVAPVFVDLVADHLLAHRFETEEAHALADFSAGVYTVLERARALYPDPARRFLDAMRKHDLLAGYGETAVIERAFARIAQRLGQADIVAPAMHALRSDYAGFEADFIEYYPDLKRHTSTWLAAQERAWGT